MKLSWIRLLSLLLLAQPAAAEDAMQWMQRTMASWELTARAELRLDERAMPWVIFFDANDVWHLRPDEELLATIAPEPHTLTTLELGERSLPLYGHAHDGEIHLPDGGAIPPQLILFASTYGEQAAPYFVFAMPAIWRATPRHAGEEGLDALIAGVFVHEITHTQQAATLGRRVDELVARHRLDDDAVDDDMIQRRFGERPGAQESFEAERDLYFQAASAPSDEIFRARLRDALQSTQSRRAQWYQGEDALYAEFEEIFLLFEGSANWAAYRALVRSGSSEQEALPTLRRGGKWWSQDLGLALFLNMERLGVPWRESAFSMHFRSPFELLWEGLGSGQ